MSNGGADQRRHLRWLVASSSWYPLKLPISPLGVWFSASPSMAQGQQDRMVGGEWDSSADEASSHISFQA
mgnify:CR=1 FL=1